MRHYRILLSFAVFAASFVWNSVLVSADWPAWRGPNRDSLCQEKGLLKEWPENGPPLAWKTTGIGEGYSGPAVVGNLLYITGHKDDKQWVFALDLGKQGKQVWAADFGPVRHPGSGFPGTRATPTIDGDRLYVLGIAGELTCMDIENGKIIWRKDFVKDFGGVTPNWGFAESPLIDGELLICTPGGRENTMVALKKTDGSVAWHSALGDKTDYSSVVKAKIGGIEQYINATHQGVIGVESQTGNLLWRYARMAVPPGMHSGSNIATCIVSGDSVFAARAYNHGGGRADIVRNGDKFEAQEAFFTEKLQNHHGGVVLAEGMLYGSSNPNLLTCMDYKTGEVKWADRGSGKCSVLYADGMLFCRDEKGPLTLVAATPEGYKQKGRFEQPDRSRKNAWPHLVIADGMMYVRDQDVLLCYDVREKK
ncbi:MAG: PQQ-like beta-propeller repeat protein [Pirellulales bacterium]|nr:PQQ-like beta-propeller repeat protein [Pirellulales bacterium]